MVNRHDEQEKCQLPLGRSRTPWASACENVSNTESPKCNAGMLSIIKSASNEIYSSQSGPLLDTASEIGTSGWVQMRMTFRLKFILKLENHGPTTQNDGPTTRLRTATRVITK